MTIDLQPFCAADNDNGHYVLSQPWVSKGVRYASDACICVAVPAPGEADSADRGCPGAAGVIVRPDADLLLAWPTDPKTRPGLVTCESCGSTVTADDGIVVLRPGTIIARKYYRLIDALPGAKSWHQAERLKSIYFCFDGGEGALMPLKDKP